jgi:Domain of unknown function (DUF397)
MSESLTWVKSRYSSTGNCVEVAGQPGRVLIRDTKDQSGPVLSISAEAWRRFTAQVKHSLAATSAGAAVVGRGALVGESALQFVADGRVCPGAVPGYESPFIIGCGSVSVSIS